MNYLGIDYGQKYIGLAIATSELAEPIITVSTAKVIPYIKKLIYTHHLTHIVIGLSEGSMAQKTRVFASALAQTFNLPVIFQDETLSSQDTRRAVAQMGMKKSKREAKIDHLVAATILQDYLDTQDKAS